MKTIPLRKSFGFLMLIAIIGLNFQESMAHCEIPCGIYADSVRIALIKEHIATIEKSMNQINEISKSTSPNYNQLIRWVSNKEDHAKKIQEIVSQYFLTQRIKFDDKEYDKKVSLLQKILVYAMKCKQTVDLGNLKKLREVCREFEDLYLKDHDD